MAQLVQSSMMRRGFDDGKGDPIIRRGYYYENQVLVGKESSIMKRKFYYDLYKKEVLCQEQNLIMETEVPWREKSSIMAKDEFLVGKECSVNMRRMMRRELDCGKVSVTKKTSMMTRKFFYEKKRNCY